ncbi:S1C family serine protease, partial [Nocardioides dubius]
PGQSPWPPPATDAAQAGARPAPQPGYPAAGQPEQYGAQQGHSPAPGAPLGGPGHPGGAQAPGSAGYSAQQPGIPAALVKPQRRSRAGAVGLLVGALLLGGGAGVAGAAAWTAGNDSTSSGSVQHSSVVDTGVTKATDGSVQSVADKVLPSVVQIEVTGQQGSGSGSGIILSSDGQILTNDHVVELAGQGGTVTVAFSDGTRARATVVGTDPLTDLAVIKAENVSGLTPANLGKSSNIAVGQDVVAIGSPYGLDATVTSGIVSALNRPVEVAQDQQGNATAYAAIQTDAAINPGNSGGPLVDMNGNVIGINASIQTSSSGGYDQTSQGGSIGLGFAIPIDAALPIVEQIQNGETPTHARLGITVADVRTDDTGATGAQIQEATSGNAAEAAGLKAGDVITKIDDHQVTGSEALIATVRGYRPGDKVEITYIRNGNAKTTTLTLGSDAP